MVYCVNYNGTIFHPETEFSKKGPVRSIVRTYVTMLNMCTRFLAGSTLLNTTVCLHDERCEQGNLLHTDNILYVYANKHMVMNIYATCTHIHTHICTWAHTNIPMCTHSHTCQKHTLILKQDPITEPGGSKG